MAQHDYVIANGTGAAVRSDINNGLAAIVSNNSGATAPSTTYAYQWWADTTTGLLKLRNAANNAWITLFQLDGEWSTLAIENGSAAAPSIYFKDSGTDTGIYSPGADQVGISTGGTGRLVIDSSGNVNIDSNTLYVDASNNRVGLGTGSPGTRFDIASNFSYGTASSNVIRLAASYSGGTATSPSSLGAITWGNNDTASEHGRINVAIINPSTSNNSQMEFWINNSGMSQAMTLTPTGLGIGTTSPTNALHVNSGATGTSTILESTGGGSYLGIKNSSGQWTLGATSTSFILENSGGEALRVDGSRRLLVGTSTSVSASSDSKLELIQDGVAAPAHLTIGNSYTTPASGEGIGMIRFYGKAGGVWEEGARITARYDASPGSGDKPCRLEFSTTADGASSPTERIRISSNGDITAYNTGGVFPNSDNATLLGISGKRWSAIWAANGTIQTSDERTKTSVEDAALGADFIKSLRPVSYKWIEGGKRHTGEYDENNNFIYESVPGTRTHWGFIAQEVKQVVDAAGVDFGGWVLTDKDDPDSQQALRYDQFIAPLTKALQEALQKIEDLETRLSALESA